MLREILTLIILNQAYGCEHSSGCLTYPQACDGFVDKVCCSRNWITTCCCKATTLSRADVVTTLSSSLLFSSFYYSTVPMTYASVAPSAEIKIKTDDDRNSSDPTLVIEVGFVKLLLSEVLAMLIVLLIVLMALWFACKRIIIPYVWSKVFPTRRNDIEMM